MTLEQVKLHFAPMGTTTRGESDARCPESYAPGRAHFVQIVSRVVVTSLPGDLLDLYR
jgi:hypothetical protein